MSQTLGNKIKDFLFEAPTEDTMKDFPAAKEHMTKEQALEAIRKAWDHPFGGKDFVPAAAPVDASAPADDDMKTLGEKIKDFLFEAPTEETMKDFPAAKENMTKEQAAEAIHKAWDHTIL